MRLEVQEDIRDLKDRIGFKERRRFAAENVKDYRKCDEITEEISSLKHRCLELEAELKQLKSKDRQSKWYFKKKSSSDSVTRKAVCNHEMSGSESASDTPPMQKEMGKAPV